MEFKSLSDWIVYEDTCAFRIKKGGDVNNVKDRVAFIERTPRVRLSKYSFGLESNTGTSCIGSDKDAWLQGPKGDDGFDPDSRAWCDQMLQLLGYE